VEVVHQEPERGAGGQRRQDGGVVAGDDGERQRGDRADARR